MRSRGGMILTFCLLLINRSSQRRPLHEKLSLISLYVFGLALILTSALMLSHPPTTVFAAACAASCQYGSDISVSGSACSCTDNVGCTWTSNGRTYSQQCAKRAGEDEIAIEESAN